MPRLWMFYEALGESLIVEQNWWENEVINGGNMTKYLNLMKYFMSKFGYEYDLLFKMLNFVK